MIPYTEGHVSSPYTVRRGYDFNFEMGPWTYIPTENPSDIKLSGIVIGFKQELEHGTQYIIIHI